MAQIRNVEFEADVAAVVERLVGRFVGMCGEDHCHSTGGQIRFSMRPPENGKVADGIIMRIGSRRGLAVLKRARTPKIEPREMLITPDTEEAAYRLGASWFDEMEASWAEKKTHKDLLRWTTDELIITLDTYFRVPHTKVTSKHPDVIALSDDLRRLAAYKNPQDAKRYRNANGAAMKLMNFYSIDPDRKSKGLVGASEKDLEIWNRYGSKPEQVQVLAVAIREAMRSTELTPTNDFSGEQDSHSTEAIEGAVLSRLHRLRERSTKLINLKKRSVLRKEGALRCEACSFDFLIRYGERGREYIECHHTTPLSTLPEHKTTLDDLALICANCHRMIHAKKHWLTIAELRLILGAQTQPSLQS